MGKEQSVVRLAPDKNDFAPSPILIVRYPDTCMTIVATHLLPLDYLSRVFLQPHQPTQRTSPKIGCRKVFLLPSLALCEDIHFCIRGRPGSGGDVA